MAGAANICNKYLHSRITLQQTELLVLIMFNAVLESQLISSGVRFLAVAILKPSRIARSSAWETVIWERFFV